MKKLLTGFLSLAAGVASAAMAPGEFHAADLTPLVDERTLPGSSVALVTADGAALPKEKRKFEATRIWTSGKWDNGDCRGFGEFMFVE